MAVSIAAVAPAYCAACFQARADVVHVDFGAAYDGPVLRQESGEPQTIDDLIVCASCVRDAARALAIVENPAGDAEHARADAERRAGAWKAYAEALEGAHARRPEPPRRGPGRPPRQPVRPGEVAA